MHTSLLGLLPADEANKHEIWFQAKMLNINEFDTKACPATKVGDDHDDDDDLPGQTETQTEQSQTQTV